MHNERILSWKCEWMNEFNEWMSEERKIISEENYGDLRRIYEVEKSVI